MAKSLLSVRSKKKKPRSPKFLDEKYTGPEPSFIGHEMWTDKEIEDMFRHGKFYYNYHASAKQLRTEVIRYAKKHIKKISESKLRSAPDFAFGIALCSVCKMINNGAPLSKERKEWIESKVLEILARVSTKPKVKKETQPEKPSIQDRVKEKISEYIAEIEEQLDLFVTSKYKTEFKIYDWLKVNDVKSSPANRIAEYYEPQLLELDELIGKNPDGDLVEGYSHLKKTEMRRLHAFIKEIVDDCKSHANNQKVVRKTRAKKPVSVDKQVGKVQYLNESNEYKIASISPANIIGASQLLVFNVKYRKLTHYVTDNPNGFAVKGTTIQNFDADASMTKGLRKPNEVLPKVMTGGKRVLNGLMDSINTKASAPNGRLNKDTLILKAIK